MNSNSFLSAEKTLAMHTATTSVQQTGADWLPRVGLGTFQLRNTADSPNVVHRTLDAALAVGYRLIDTASCYRNEKDIGEALAVLLTKHNLQRSDMVITSKVAPKDQGYEQAIRSCRQSIADLGCDHLDLLLIHWPGKSKLKPEDAQQREWRKNTWHAFEWLNGEGLAKHIGVSNFCVQHLQQLKEDAVVVPAVNQVEFHPHLTQSKLLAYCLHNNIFLQAYSSLGQGGLLANDRLNELAKEIGKSPSQLLLQWALQQGVGILPKSTNPEHLRENFMGYKDKCDSSKESSDIWSLTDSHMDSLMNLNLDKHYCWDPNTIV